MRLDLFHPRPEPHIRKAQEYLEEARLARIEHEVAAEHHAALGAMYAQRIARLEQQIAEALLPYASPRPTGESTQAADATKRGAAEGVISLPRVPRIAGADGD